MIINVDSCGLKRNLFSSLVWYIKLIICLQLILYITGKNVIPNMGQNFIHFSFVIIGTETISKHFWSQVSTDDPGYLIMLQFTFSNSLIIQEALSQPEHLILVRWMSLESQWKTSWKHGLERNPYLKWFQTWVSFKAVFSTCCGCFRKASFMPSHV